MNALVACVLLLVAEPAPEASDQPGSSEAIADPSPSPLVRGLSWDVLGGGVPTSGALLQAELGFTVLPKVSYHRSLRRGFSVGGSAALEMGWYAPDIVANLGLLLTAPIRYTLHRSESSSAGVRIEPGVLLDFFGNSKSFGLVGILSGSWLFLVQDRLLVGPSVDVPLLLAIGTGNGTPTLFIVPILLGAQAEFHVTPPLAITFDAKIGPHLRSRGPAEVGLKIIAGASYRL